VLLGGVDDELEVLERRGRRPHVAPLPDVVGDERETQAADAQAAQIGGELGVGHDAGEPLVPEIGQIDAPAALAQHGLVDQREELALAERADLQRLERLAAVADGGARHDERDLVHRQPARPAERRVELAERVREHARVVDQHRRDRGAVRAVGGIWLGNGAGLHWFLASSGRWRRARACARRNQ
jgi:hypothetical protein